MRGEVCEIIDAPRRTLQIGIHAYECLPGLVFVKDPSLRARYMLVDRCVAEVDCPYDRCGSVSGEPCKHNGRYFTGVHTFRKAAWKKIRHERPRPKPKIRICADDYLGATAELPKETEA